VWEAWMRRVDSPRFLHTAHTNKLYPRYRQPVTGVPPWDAETFDASNTLLSFRGRTGPFPGSHGAVLLR
jgi:hypothetical protein